MNRADFVAHGVTNQLVSSVVHDKDLIDTELLAGWYRERLMRAALESDALCPQVAPHLYAPIRHVNSVIST